MKWRCRGAIDKNQIFLLPTVDFINSSGYYGYTVIAVGFAWLCFRFKIWRVKMVWEDNQ